MVIDLWLLLACQRVFSIEFVFQPKNKNEIKLMMLILREIWSTTSSNGVTFSCCESTKDISTSDINVREQPIEVLSLSLCLHYYHSRDFETEVFFSTILNDFSCMYLYIVQSALDVCGVSRRIKRYFLFSVQFFGWIFLKSVYHSHDFRVIIFCFSFSFC